MTQNRNSSLLIFPVKVHNRHKYTHTRTNTIERKKTHRKWIFCRFSNFNYSTFFRSVCLLQNNFAFRLNEKHPSVVSTRYYRIQNTHFAQLYRKKSSTFSRMLNFNPVNVDEKTTSTHLYVNWTCIFFVGLQQQKKSKQNRKQQITWFLTHPKYRQTTFCVLIYSSNISCHTYLMYDLSPAKISCSSLLLPIIDMFFVIPFSNRTPFRWFPFWHVFSV